MKCPKCGSEMEKRRIDNPNKETVYGYRCMNEHCELFRQFQPIDTYQQRLDKVLSKFRKLEDNWYTLNSVYVNLDYLDGAFNLNGRNGIKLSLETVESLLKDLNNENS